MLQLLHLVVLNRELLQRCRREKKERIQARHIVATAVDAAEATLTQAKESQKALADIKKKEWDAMIAAGESSAEEEDDDIVGALCESSNKWSDIDDHCLEVGMNCETMEEAENCDRQCLAVFQSEQQAGEPPVPVPVQLQSTAIFSSIVTVAFQASSHNCSNDCSHDHFQTVNGHIHWVLKQTGNGHRNGHLQNRLRKQDSHRHSHNPCFSKCQKQNRHRHRHIRWV